MFLTEAKVCSRNPGWQRDIVRACRYRAFCGGCCRSPEQWSCTTQESPISDEIGLSCKNAGGVLLSREAPLAVPSALRGLTSGFGMGPGVSPSLWPPQRCGVVRPGSGRVPRTAQWTRTSARLCVCQALGLLVPVSCTPCGASTSGLSTQSSGWGPYPVKRVGDLILKRASRLDAFSGYHFPT